MATESIVVTGPTFQQKKLGSLALVPTGAVTQQSLADMLSPIAGGTTPLTVRAGSAASGRSRYSTVPVGSVAYASMGTDTTLVAGTIYWAEVAIPRNITLTGIAVLNGGTVGTNKGIVGLYNSAGTLVANSALVGAIAAGANAFQAYAFTATYAAVGPARYWVAYQADGATATLRTIAASTFIDSLTKSATGAFGTLTALTVPTTITADVGPIAYVY
ncbi:MAG TPA: hypothetical protein VN702_17580 [Acetobacteraceae bacterium]|nr:hypothetical protein [Acetobacteraceae bacterium]